MTDAESRAQEVLWLAREMASFAAIGATNVCLGGSADKASAEFERRRAALESAVRALAEPPSHRLAGHFVEVPSAMNRRLWEQVQDASVAGSVALYEATPPAVKG